ncbi:PEP-CTERM sorting domain-containing protein [Merismopedia glauca]|uniref:PEP-CTERM protein-sorting domain-containing protein n=1 Tax=Merismopedia glauca CCAP 1448/3 TaxID=1296344 RepID=A0A2T1BZD6_9CYAN|nr:PEP-CTERM sorting domain-containing protein [Merismopedia glauca]PSB01277.1 hypothetical protein C7B64_19225 [Merismopedia glauca CCAP 1448/3]
MKGWQHFLGAIALRAAQAITTSLVIAVGISTAAQATTKITFDEVPEGTPIDDLKIKGVNFDYKVFGEDSDGAYTVNFGSYPPSLDGNALLLDNGNSVLTLDFDNAIHTLTFKADWICTLTPECASPSAGDYTVKLFDEALSSWQEFTPYQSFSYFGSPIKRVIFEFNPEKVEEFALDNLTFNKVGNPEPATILGTLALGGLGLAKWKKAKH